MIDVDSTILIQALKTLLVLRNNDGIAVYGIDLIGPFEAKYWDHLKVASVKASNMTWNDRALLTFYSLKAAQNAADDLNAAMNLVQNLDTKENNHGV